MECTNLGRRFGKPRPFLHAKETQGRQMLVAALEMALDRIGGFASHICRLEIVSTWIDDLSDNLAFFDSPKLTRIFGNLTIIA